MIKSYRVIISATRLRRCDIFAKNLRLEKICFHLRYNLIIDQCLGLRNMWLRGREFLPWPAAQLQVKIFWDPVPVYAIPLRNGG